ncbi:MAG: prepilin-type N-terminal cleavage/methylation domain-containing protein [Pseudomonadota bacterium]
MHGRPRRSAGFTLLELVVALALSAGVIALAVQLYQTVVRAGDALTGGQRDWTAEQFLRAQLLAADDALNKRFETVLGESDRLSFLTRKSAQFGEDSLPVLATYTIVSGTAVRYAEVALPPWWTERTRDALIADRLRELETIHAWRDVLLPQITAATFSYWDGKFQQWANRWPDKDKLPAIVRLEVQSLGETKRLVMETRALSFSLSSGS